MKLFKVTFLQQWGKECDCCVVTLRVNADIFAHDEIEANGIFAKHAGFSRIADLKRSEGVEIPLVDTPGIKVNSTTIIFEGVDYESPLDAS